MNIVKKLPKGNIMWIILIFSWASCATMHKVDVLKAGTLKAPEPMATMYIPVIIKPTQDNQYNDTPKNPKQNRKPTFDGVFKGQVQSFMDDYKRSSALNLVWQQKYLELAANKGRERVEEIDSLKYYIKKGDAREERYMSLNDRLSKQHDIDVAERKTAEIEAKKSMLTNRIIIYLLILIGIIGLGFNVWSVRITKRIDRNVTN